ncbi:hypothetical protein [Microlunatus ginsengisoli]|uniref:Uncharacterized protein n=1 Tax=Microlunatus ginsengisoli TaxID=363863 RepID=A0ABP7AIJ0_9ACTN
MEDSTANAEPEDDGRSKTTDSSAVDNSAPAVDNSAPTSDIDSPRPLTVVAEMLPGVAVVFGEVPAELELDLIDFGLVSTDDQKQVSNVLASIGTTATVAGNLGNALASARGLYKLSDATQALLKAGGTLAVKDGANLGTVLLPGTLAQARFIPVTAVSAAGVAAALGPAVAMIALQMSLNEISGLVTTNIALTSQVLTDIRHDQWTELTGLVATIDRVVDQAREVESVPKSLWETVAGKRANLLKQRDLYRMNVGNHARQIAELDTRRRREYLETNAQAIVFDANALLSSLKAWTGYQALHAARARSAGQEDAGEARLVDAIARETRDVLDSSLAETTRLLDALTRELRVVAELPGHDTLPLPGKRKDSRAARRTAARLLHAIEPVANALHPPAPPLGAPAVVCAPETLDLKPYLRILRWFVEDDETLRVIGFPHEFDALGPVSAILDTAKEKWAAARDKAPARTLVAVTDRRIVTAETNAFLEHGEMRPDIPIDQVRYVRTTTTRAGTERLAIDLITREKNIRWLFSADVGTAQTDALAAVLAESMTIPDAERDELQQRRVASIETNTGAESADTGSSDPIGSEATTCNPE